MYTISNIAKEADVGVETTRFYERKNFLQQPIKPMQRYLQYSQQALSRVLFIKRAPHLGFTLAEISQLLASSVTNCDNVQYLAERKLRLIDDKLNDLLRLQESLVPLVLDFKNNLSNNDCPIIQPLQTNNIPITCLSS